MKSKRKLIVGSESGNKEMYFEWFGQYTQIYTGSDQAILNGQIVELRKQLPISRPVIVASDPLTGEMMTFDPEAVKFKR